MGTRAYLAFSDAGMGKSTFALGRVKLNSDGSPFSTSTRKTFYAEFDPGSFDRAINGMKYDSDRLTINRYRTPFTSLSDFGKLSTAMVGQNADKGTVTIVHRLSGWQEEYWRFVGDVLAAIQTGDYDTCVIDTVKREWEMAQNAFRQRIQDETSVDRDRLNRLEYSEPNAQQYQIKDLCNSHNTDLVYLSHEAPVYKDGKIVDGAYRPDGWNDAAKIADISLRFTLRVISGKLTPIASVHKLGGADLAMIGREFESPTLDSVSELMDAAAVLHREGVMIPGSNKEIIEMAKVLTVTG